MAYQVTELSDLKDTAGNIIVARGQVFEEVPAILRRSLSAWIEQGYIVQVPSPKAAGQVARPAVPRDEGAE